MKILVVGGPGMIGTHVVAALGDRREILSVGHRRGDYQVDSASPTPT